MREPSEVSPLLSGVMFFFCGFCCAVWVLAFVPAPCCCVFGLAAGRFFCALVSTPAKEISSNSTKAETGASHFLLRENERGIVYIAGFPIKKRLLTCRIMLRRKRLSPD